MKYRRLGQQGPRVSVVSIGTWPLAGADWGKMAPERAVRIMRGALDAGVNLIDTADSYGSGRAEVLVSMAIRGRREEVVLATKCGISFQSPAWRIDLRPAYVRHAVEQSLIRLGTDYVDLLQLHWPDGQPIEEAWEAVGLLHQQGKVRFVGVSNFSVAQLQRLEALRHVDSLQAQYSMLWRDPDQGTLPYCAASGTGFLAYGPLAYGLLSGKYADRSQLKDWRAGEGKYANWDYIQRLFAPGVFERNARVVDGLRPIAASLGITMPQLALSWVASRPGVSSVIAGARSPEQARHNAGAGDFVLEADVLGQIDAILAAGRAESA